MEKTHFVKFGPFIELFWRSQINKQNIIDLIVLFQLINFDNILTANP